MELNCLQQLIFHPLVYIFTCFFILKYGIHAQKECICNICLTNVILITHIEVIISKNNDGKYCLIILSII